MGALDAFYSTWSDARETFGQGAPQDGGKLDNSSQLMQMKAGVEAAAPDGRWHGPASEAYAAKNKAHAGVYGKLAELDTKMATEVTNAANVVTAGRQSLENTKSWVDSAANSIPPGTSAADRDNKLLSIANQGIGQVSNIVTEATNKMTDISQSVQGLKGRYDAIANGKPDPQEKGPGNILFGTDPEKKDDAGKKTEKPELNSKNGQLDGDTLKSPWMQTMLLPGFHERLLEAGTLSPEQLNDLAHGKPVVVGEDRMAYLYQLSQSLNGMTPEQIRAMQASLPPEEQKALAQGLAIVSDPNAKSGNANTEGVTDATRDSFVPAAGSLINLPDGMYQELSRGDRVTVEYPHGVGDRNTPPTTHLNGVGALQDISEIFRPAEGAYLNGSEASQSMLDAFTQYAKTDVDHRNIGVFNNIESDAHGPLKNALSDVVQVAGRDHVGVHNLVTGSQGDDFLTAITQETWGDQSSKVGDAFRWMDDDPNNRINSETANAVGHYMAENAPELKVLPWTHDDTFAVANPGLASAMAEGISPYLTEFAGGGPAMGSHEGVTAFDNGGQLQDLFSIFDRNAESAVALNQAARDQFNGILADATSGDHIPNGNQLEIAGRLQNAMIDGAHDAAQEHQGEDLDTLKTVLGYAQIPYFDELSDLGDIWQKIQKGELPEAYTEAQANQGTGTLAFQTSILNAMIANTPEIAQDPRVSPYIVGNHIEIPPELKSNAGNDFTKWFIEVAKPIYGIDQSDWESQRNRGNNDDW